MSKRNAVVAILVALALAHPAQAAGTRTADQPLVVLTEEGRQDAEDTAFFASVRALAAEIGIGVSAHQVPTFEAVRDTLLAEARQQSKPFLVAWIVREAGTRRIHLFDPWKNQLRTREVEAGTSPTANAETLALILRAELLAYLNEPPPPQPVIVVPTPPPPPRPDPTAALSLSYVAGNFLRDSDIQHGLRLGLGYRGAHLRMGIFYEWIPGQEVRAGGVAMTVQRHPFGVDAGYASAERNRLRFAAEIVVSGDPVSRHTSTVTAPLAAQPDDYRFVLGAGLCGRAELRILRNLTLHVALGAEAPLNPHDFQIERGTTSTTIARLSPVRVIGEAGLAVLTF